MHRNFSRQKSVLPVLTLVFVMSMVAAGQQQQAALMAGMAENASHLKQYTFKQRTETYHKGELKNAKVDEVHYNAAGERVGIPLDDKRVDSEPRRRGPGSRLIAKKIEQEQGKMKDYIERLMSLTSRYLASNPAKLQAAIADAEITTGGGSNQVRIRMRNYVKNGDSMTMSFDPVTGRPTITEVNTSLDESPVTISLAFDQIRNGPSYPGKMVLKSQAKELELRVLTYDYRL
jgi:hypothetical protein